MTLLDALREETSHKATVTENGMPTHTSSMNACLDLFGSLGSARGWSEENILGAFTRAIAEDPLLALRILFWARDVRKGAGERRIFRVCLNYLNNQHREYLDKNIHLVPEYGRWDDLFGLNNENVLFEINNALKNNDGLAAKWLPRKGVFANKLRKFLELDPKGYRKLLVGLSKTVEQQMCAGEWDKIDYSHVPSQAMLKYRTAFYRHDEERFQQFLDNAKTGKTKINAGAMYPYQLYDAIVNTPSKETQAIEAQWKALPNFLENTDEKILPVCDVSGSMHNNYAGNVSPMSVSISLGIYISERNVGPFKDAFLTFSNRPTLQYLTGSLYDRCHQLLCANWDMNTNLERVFLTVLNAAIKNETSVKEMPTMLLIISDMQFDRCVKNKKASATEMITGMYKTAGYEVPKVVFWNVNARTDQSPVKADENNVALVSGCSPSILKSVLSGKVFNPVQIMLDTVNSERYSAVQI